VRRAAGFCVGLKQRLELFLLAATVLTPAPLMPAIRADEPSGVGDRLPAAGPGGSFEQKLNLDAFRLVAVQHQGRFKTFDTLAREMIRHVTGRTYFKREIPGTDTVVKQDPVFLYLDVVFKPESYADVRLIHVKMRPMRRALANAATERVDRAVLDAIVDDGLVSLNFLILPAVRAELDEMRRDVMRTAKYADAVINAAGWVDAGALAGLMRMIPPPDARSVGRRWYGVDALSTVGAPHDATHTGLIESRSIAGMDPSQREVLAETWSAAREAWRAGEAGAATKALNSLADALSQMAPQIYPPHRKLALEHWYYKYNKMTWTWWFYMAAVVFLLMGIVYRWPRARLIGAAVFGLAFCLHTVATGVRWYLAGRIPNANMFEAVTAAAWFGAAIAIFFELGPRLCRRRGAWRIAWVAAAGGAVVFLLSLAVRGVALDAWQQWGPVPIAALIVLAAATMALISLAVARRRGAGRALSLLGAGVVAMVGLMCGRYMTVALPSDIRPAMPILNDLWLYLHVNMIIASYALIGMAFVTAGMYVVGRLLTRPSGALWLSMLIPAVVVPLPALLPTISLKEVLPAWLPFLAVIASTLVCYPARLIGGRVVAARSWAAWEGLPAEAASVPAPGGGGSTGSTVRIGPGLTSGPTGDAGGDNAGLAKVLDGATMLLLELSFITLWVGIIMGAIWADHSWGRPWGWDPKEVFALNTWIIFLILVHVRIKVRDKAGWTAVLAVIGCSVMLFNWIVVNYFITGLHSYA